MESKYEIPSPGALSINSEKLLDYDEKHVQQLLELSNVSPETLRNDLNHLKTWYSKQPHLPDDPFLSRRIFQILLLTGASVEKAKVKLDNYYSLKNKFPEILKNRDPCAPEIDRELRSGYFVALPKRTPEHHRITMARLKTIKTDQYPLDASKMLFMYVDYRFCNDLHLGEHWVFDCRNTTLGSAVYFTPYVPKLFVIWISGYTGRVKGIYLVHMPSYLEPIIKMLKRMIKNKIVDRFQLYNDFDELFKVLPRSLFPSDYGGDGQSCDELCEAMADTLQSPVWREWFLAQESVCADESKRCRDPSYIHDHRDIFGADGSFKQLTID